MRLIPPNTPTWLRLLLVAIFAAGLASLTDPLWGFIGAAAVAGVFFGFGVRGGY